MSQDLAGFAEATCGSKPIAVTRVAGGDISGASLIEFADGSKVVGKTGPVVAVEARMLEAMGESAAPSPKVIGFDERHLVIEYLPSDGMLAGNAWVSLAGALDALHSMQGDAFGWQENYALRHVTVENQFTENWPQFWGERRLLCHVPHIAADLGRRIEELAKGLPDLLPAVPKPALVHGDLWGGNVLVSGERISGLIDPCACYGDREVDVASLTVFDAPTPAFFDALELERGWRNRLPIYRLWMWLLHVRLFGESYRPAVERELAALSF
ncbi:fructosamine kinase family protein [Qipengyuania gelatinilytica]|uniref:Fructosamine kinase family protein n=1 Tax=Qipengyuania gelatinilytica TaxID=2867231 RepID=A0ABX9A1G2_9SPHN|nr:fructosamine kinase family protein [Qipengyuania gelatinilytica]QZD95102.1 fructosamine kinase family protein [Qipengyuania gelatinilytica]